jgi:hypothetical protein
MIFSVDQEGLSLGILEEREHAELDILERQDLQEWAIEEPRLLGEELLIISAEYANFQDTRNRLDILALDQVGRLVVIELKRDRADRTTELQAIKYASYCATLTAREIQQDYREFWSDRGSTDLTSEDVGETFQEFLSGIQDLGTDTEGWAVFELDDRPGIVLLAGSFGVEVTAPVLWLSDEYGMDIRCRRVRAYEHAGETLLDSQQVIPVPEAEGYRTRRKLKQDTQTPPRRDPAVDVLLERGVLKSGQTVEFDRKSWDDNHSDFPEADSPIWRATVTGNQGRSNDVRWEHDGELYSFSGLTREVLHKTIGRDLSDSINGYRHWLHPQFDDRTLRDLRNSGVTSD